MKNLIASLLLCFVLLTPAAVFAQEQSSCPVPVLHWRNAITANEIRECLSHAKSIQDWTRDVEIIKGLNSGKLPGFWKVEIIDSGYFAGLRDSWDIRLRKTDDEK